ncbi:hypothetical protein [Kozakia baliensis]|uniref:hypothetical protein n=1 Tax=Kozakia baliensis TaxID=153496 RepID=UPI0012679C46|nr:hypothetical protein [Kozakia baliensis]
MTSMLDLLTIDDLNEVDRLALHWLRILMSPRRSPRGREILPRQTVSDLKAVHIAFKNALARLTPLKRRWLDLGAPSTLRVTETELHCLDALAAAQNGAEAELRLSLRAVFPQACARAPFLAAFELLGTWLAVSGNWLDRVSAEANNGLADERIVAPPITTRKIMAPCDRCSACGNNKVTLGSFACLAALSRWRETLSDDAILLVEVEHPRG